MFFIFHFTPQPTKKKIHFLIRETSSKQLRFLYFIQQEELLIEWLNKHHSKVRGVWGTPWDKILDDDHYLLITKIFDTENSIHNKFKNMSKKRIKFDKKKKKWVKTKVFKKH